MPLWGQRMLDTFAVPVGRCDVRVLDEPAATRLLRGSPGLLLSLHEVNGPRLCHYVGRCIDVTFRSFECRLARFLLNNADRDGLLSGLTHDCIAQALRTPHT